MLHACVVKFDVMFWGENFWELNTPSYLEWLVSARNNGFSSQHHKTGNIVCVILYVELDLSSRKEGIVS
jgi:hypothetical protein